MIEILYEDSQIVAVNKPTGLLVHRTRIAEEENDFLLQKLRDQLQRKLYPIHRLDRPTSGIVLFAFSSEDASLFSQMIQTNAVEKEYLALVRGWFPDNVDLDHPVKNEKGNSKEAHTIFKNVKHYEIEIPSGRYTTTRFSLIECFPKSGRWHQLRQHLAHLRHYIINDRVHGDGKCNRFFSDHFGHREMFLHAVRLTFEHPVTKQQIIIHAPLPVHWDVIGKSDVCEEGV
ncbi:MAG: pseudouridine synthase [Bacteroidales bacterium]